MTGQNIVVEVFVNKKNEEMHSLYFGFTAVFTRSCFKGDRKCSTLFSIYMQKRVL